jgi:hypothetical protein
MVGEVIDQLSCRWVIGSFEVHVDVTDDEHRFDERQLGEERRRYGSGPAAVDDGCDTRERTGNDADAQQFERRWINTNIKSR